MDDDYLNSSFYITLLNTNIYFWISSFRNILLNLVWSVNIFKDILSHNLNIIFPGEEFVDLVSASDALSLTQYKSFSMRIFRWIPKKKKMHSSQSELKTRGINQTQFFSGQTSKESEPWRERWQTLSEFTGRQSHAQR